MRRVCRYGRSEVNISSFANGALGGHAGGDCGIEVSRQEATRIGEGMTT